MKRPIINDIKIAGLSEMTPAYFRSVFEQIPANLYVNVRLFTKNTCSLSTLFKEWQSFKYAYNAFCGLIPIINTWDVAGELNAITDGDGHYASWGKTVKERLVKLTYALEEFYEHHSEIPYGHFYLRQKEYDTQHNGVYGYPDDLIAGVDYDDDRIFKTRSA